MCSVKWSSVINLDIYSENSLLVYSSEFHFLPLSLLPSMWSNSKCALPLQMSWTKIYKENNIWLYLQKQMQRLAYNTLGDMIARTVTALVKRTNLIFCSRIIFLISFHSWKSLTTWSGGGGGGGGTERGFKLSLY